MTGYQVTKTCLAKHLFILMQCFGAAAIPCNSWLFLLRVRALPRHVYSRITLAVCTVLWVATFTSFLVFLGVRAMNFPSPPGQCFAVVVFDIRFMYPPFIILFAFDTAVAISILLGLSAYHANTLSANRVRETILLEGIGPLCQVLLQSGYIYYLSVRLCFSNSIPFWRLTLISI